MESIIVFGTGIFYQSKKRNLEKKYIVKAYLDNKVDEDSRQMIYGIPTYNPKQVKEFSSEKIVIMSNHFIPMWKQLVNLGVEESRILFGIDMEPYAEGQEYLHNSSTKIIAENENLYYYAENRKKYSFNTVKQWEKVKQSVKRNCYNYQEMIDMLPIRPISREFGFDRGMPIDRYYIENFLNQNRKYISGDVLEIAERIYTIKYGESQVKNSYIMHVEGGEDKTVIKGNLATGEGIEENMVDCLILTQTLPFIFDLNNVIENIYKILKPGGRALITVPGITQISRYDMERWGHFWSFTSKSIQQLFEAVTMKDNIIIESYGNVKTSVAMLYGLAVEDLRKEDFDHNDDDYQVIISAIIKKVG